MLKRGREKNNKYKQNEVLISEKLPFCKLHNVDRLITCLVFKLVILPESKTKRIICTKAACMPIEHISQRQLASQGIVAQSAARNMPYYPVKEHGYIP